MADNAEASSDAQLSFKVKTGGDSNKTHSVTMAESATVLDLKTKLSGEEYENIPVDRQRLIYSGRVMKNDEPLSTYKIKAGNTIHLVKSAASNPAPAPSNPSAPTPQAVPSNMAAGTSANNLLAGLTGARFAGHAPLPNQNIFGPDGGMNLPSEDQVEAMLSDPNVAQTMNEALNNPQIVDFMIQQNPMLRNMPNAREFLQSPAFRNMMTNPESLRMASRMRQMMGGAGGPNAFPAPGATDTTPEGAPATAGAQARNAGAAAQNPFNPFGVSPEMLSAMFGRAGGAGAGAGAGGAGLGGGADAQQNPFFALFGAPPAGSAPAAGSTATAGAAGGTGQRDTPASPPSTGQGQAAPAAAPANDPFASLFGPPGGGPQITPEMVAQLEQALGGGEGGGPDPVVRHLAQALAAGGLGSPGFASPPPDNRPPEERYAEQLRQLNDMGFYDFDRNITALRRSGGSVQGAIQHLLGE